MTNNERPALPAADVLRNLVEHMLILAMNDHMAGDKGPITYVREAILEVEDPLTREAYLDALHDILGPLA